MCKHAKVFRKLLAVAFPLAAAIPGLAADHGSHVCSGFFDEARTALLRQYFPAKALVLIKGNTLVHGIDGKTKDRNGPPELVIDRNSPYPALVQDMIDKDDLGTKYFLDRKGQKTRHVFSKCDVIQVFEPLILDPGMHTFTLATYSQSTNNENASVSIKTTYSSAEDITFAGKLEAGKIYLLNTKMDDSMVNGQKHWSASLTLWSGPAVPPNHETWEIIPFVEQ
jgi:hypothetical protein